MTGSDSRPPTEEHHPDTDAVLVDAMLGTLATYLRMCGYDAAYALDRDVEADRALLSIAKLEDRLLLTRDRKLARRAPASVLLSSHDITGQLAELQDADFHLRLPASPTRCGRCNGILAEVDESEGTPPDVPDLSAHAVWRCQDCGQYFWRGSHWDAVAEKLETV